MIKLMPLHTTWILMGVIQQTVFAPKTATRGQWNPQSLLHDKYIHVTHNPNDMKPALL